MKGLGMPLVAVVVVATAAALGALVATELPAGCLGKVLRPSEEAVLVDCNTTKGEVTLALGPSWAPLGVARYLELVNAGVFTNLPLFRCVQDFLCQYGYSPNPEWDAKFPNIQDDPPQAKLKRFHRGYISYAGSGRNSRSMHAFVTLGAHVESLGREPWETPIGFVTPESMQVVAKWETGYGDMSPFGPGPDPHKIRMEGEKYLRGKFPKLDYWTGCAVRPTTPLSLPDPTSSKSDL